MTKEIYLGKGRVFSENHFNRGNTREYPRNLFSDDYCIVAESKEQATQILENYLTTKERVWGAWKVDSEDVVRLEDVPLEDKVELLKQGVEVLGKHGMHTDSARRMSSSRKTRISDFFLF